MYMERERERERERGMKVSSGTMGHCFGKSKWWKVGWEVSQPSREEKKLIATLEQAGTG